MRWKPPTRLLKDWMLILVTSVEILMKLLESFPEVLTVLETSLAAEETP